MKLEKPRDIYSSQLEDADNINSKLIAGFEAHKNRDDIKRSHYFEGRYENIYIDEDTIAALGQIKKMACELTAQITGLDAKKLKAGLWFNAMEPGHVTLPHRHDDDDEIMSAVYYIEVPMNSGRLILNESRFTITVEPEAGLFVLFPPDMVHEVSENRSNLRRLSLGINIGPANSQQA